MKNLGIFLGIYLALGIAASCVSADQVYGQCTDQCYPYGINAQPEGSICTDAGLCACPEGQSPCCPSGPPGKCQTGSCASADTCPNEGADNDGGPPPTSECAADADCAKLVDTECKTASCAAGKCDVRIKIGPTASQRYGDCKRRECDATGAIIKLEDSSDYFNDALECTTDFCKDGASQNLPLPDGSPCGADNHCYLDACVECVDWLAGAQCSNGLVCDGFFWCVSPAQCMGKCGGSCAPCPTGSVCAKDSDCVTLNCVNGVCSLPTCSDGSQNGGETGIDCGAATCGPCPDGQGCHAHGDCLSKVCMGGACVAPTCIDGVQNGDESGVDCGGPCVACLKK